MNVGILALQGAFREHAQVLAGLGIRSLEVRLPGQLSDIDGLIIPGGESTAIGKLAASFGLIEPLRRFASDRPVWGVCAGMILLAKNAGLEQPLLGVMDIQVERNAFGRQVHSFETDLWVDDLPDGRIRPFPGVFIRAPMLVDAGPGVAVLATLPGGGAVAARQGHFMVTAFHPELTDDSRFHAMFLGMVNDAHQGGAAATGSL